ncbi:MAG: MCP four helix bundle domain-containing protein, partial [Selenomonadaceae bacterium]
MGFLQDIKVGRKLTILIFTAVFSVSVISGLGYYYLQAANESLNDMYAKKMVPMQLIMNIRGNENAMDAAVAEAVFVVDENRSKELQKNIAAEQAAISADFSKVDSLIVDEKGSDMLGKIKNIRTKYEAARSHVLALAAKRQNEEAYRDYLLTVAPLNREYAAALQELA